MIHLNVQEIKQKQQVAARISKEILIKIKYKKVLHKRWKQGQVACEEYRDTDQVCRDRTQKAKTHLELHLARDVEGSKKDFYKYIGCKRKTRENVGLLLNSTGDMLTKNREG